jgi:Mg-chelatase subunit ChlD
MKRTDQSRIAGAFLAMSFCVGNVLVAESPKASVAIPQVEVCFVLDTTGSMGSLIQSAKDKIWSIANELVSAKPTPNIKFGLVAYRDRQDTYVTKVFDLTDDIDALYEHLMALRAKGGNDTPESVNQALHDAVTKMKWSQGRRVLKLVFLVGDAPPHMDYPDDIKYPKVCELAMEKNLIINTIQCGTIAETTVVWTDIARKSEGQYAAILQSGGTVAIVTPFDKEIADVNRQLNETIVGYGDAATQLAVRSKIALNAESKIEAVADRADYFRKVRRFGGGGAGFKGKILGGKDDLIEQVIGKTIKIEEIDVDKLPADLKKMPVEKRIAVIKLKVEQRRKLQNKIDELLKHRSAFVTKEKDRLAKNGQIDSFDLKVKEIIRTQAARKGIKFDTDK